MKSAAGKRPPDEAHGPGKEAIRPQQRCLAKSRKEGAHWHAALTAGVGTALIQKHRSDLKYFSAKEVVRIFQNEYSLFKEPAAALREIQMLRG